MKRSLRTAIIGDDHPRIRAYPAICEALQHAANVLSVDVKPEWLPTSALGEDVEQQLSAFDAVWCGPWGPYANSGGAQRVIRFARESRLPFLGTCAGFQHAIIEFAHTMLGLEHAQYAEANPDAEECVINALPEPLIERTVAVTLDPKSRAAGIYRRTISAERYRCAFGLNPTFLSRLNQSGLRVSGVNEAGHATVVELADHPYFFATLFLPECSSRASAPHPLITAYVRTAAEISGMRS